MLTSRSGVNGGPILALAHISGCWPFSVGEQDALAEQVEVRAAVHLSFEHLDAVDVPFDLA
jgi:hypothetical protein